MDSPVSVNKPPPYRIARFTGKSSANLALADVTTTPVPCPAIVCLILGAGDDRETHGTQNRHI
jgi:hypothetical protein